MTSTHVMILAGGQGSRFWPISRLRRPKQFLSINASGESLIAATARRAEPLVAQGKSLGDYQSPARISSKGTRPQR